MPSASTPRVKSVLPLLSVDSIKLHMSPIQEVSPLPTLNLDASPVHKAPNHQSFSFKLKKFAHRPKYVFGSVVALSMFAVLGFGLMASMASFSQNTDDRSQASEGFAAERSMEGEGDGGETYDCATRYPGEPERVLECQALVALYESTNGNGWTNSTNWMTSEDYCSWYSVSCNANRVVFLHLTWNNLSGSIPESLGSLSKLQSLLLYQNSLSGPIPDSLGSLRVLYTLDLSNNELSGPIPSSLGSSSNLRSINLSNNNLTGPIPESFVSFTFLKTLFLYQNNLSGPIPEFLSSLAYLEKLDLSNNNFTGSIPEGLSSLSRLEDLSLAYNSLSGTIPATLGSITSLRRLTLANNNLSSASSYAIPESIGSLASLLTLSVANNNLSGQLPHAVTTLSVLDTISFNNQRTNGQLPYINTNICVSPDTRAALVALEARRPGQQVYPAVTDNIPPACDTAAPPTETPTRTPTSSPTRTPTPTQTQTQPTPTPTNTPPAPIFGSRRFTPTPTPSLPPADWPVEHDLGVQITNPNPLVVGVGSHSINFRITNYATTPTQGTIVLRTYRQRPSGWMQELPEITILETIPAGGSITSNRNTYFRERDEFNYKVVVEFPGDQNSSNNESKIKVRVR